jgi:hypothetical protein
MERVQLSIAHGSWDNFIFIQNNLNNFGNSSMQQNMFKQAF